MRRWSIVLLWFVTAACNSSPTEPSPVGSLVDIAGAWGGSFASSNNATEPIAVTLSQSGAAITGTWHGETVSWTGQVTGTINGSLFSGQMTFTGMAMDQTMCTGTAKIEGSVKSSALSWNSATGVVGGSCPAPLPVNLQVDLHR